MFSSTGGEVNHLPVTITSGSATFKAALRVRVQAGTTVEVFGTGFNFELGVYADLIEYVATIGSSDTCGLSITESIDVNIGAFARAVVEIDYKTFGASPAVVTTILDLPLPSLCLTRPVDTSMPAFTATATLFGSPVPVSVLGSYPTATAVASTTGADFYQGSSTFDGSASASASGSYAGSGSAVASDSSPGQTGYGNATITSAASMTTSTVYITDTITITSCSSAVLHCPASLTSETIITRTSVLYTTVCPVGELQTTFSPVASSSTKSSPVNTASVIVSQIPLTLCETPVVSTIYIPTFINPTYTMPTATSFTAPYPNWKATLTSCTTSEPAPTSGAEGNGGSASTITVAPVHSTYSVPIKPIAGVNSTVSATGSIKVQPTGPATFTGDASRSVRDLASCAIVALAVSFFVWM